MQTIIKVVDATPEVNPNTIHQVDVSLKQCAQ